MTAAPHPWRSVLAGAAIVLIAALILAWLGHPWICTCGTVKLWYGFALSSQTSQHLTDWYTPSHVIHGILFYFGLWLVARRLPLSTRALTALVIEATWEVVENTPWIINRYREVTISLDYFGDSVINSVADIVAMLVGFWLAARAPVWLSVLVVIALEVIVGAIVRDNLTLNTIMLIYPLDVIRAWQAGG